MRPSESIHPRLGDVDFEKQCIVIRETKYAKTRIIPATASVMQEISDYTKWLSSIIGTIGKDEPLFRTTGGKILSEPALAYAFRLIRGSIHAAPKGYPCVGVVTLMLQLEWRFCTARKNNNLQCAKKLLHWRLFVSVGFTESYGRES